MKKRELPKWAEYDTILEGVEKLQPLTEVLRKELLAGKKAKDEGKPKRFAYHTNRVVNMLFNLETYFWNPMFDWAQATEFKRVFKRRQTPLQKALRKAAKNA